MPIEKRFRLQQEKKAAKKAGKVAKCTAALGHGESETGSAPTATEPTAVTAWVDPF